MMVSTQTKALLLLLLPSLYEIVLEREGAEQVQSWRHEEVQARFTPLVGCQVETNNSCPMLKSNWSGSGSGSKGRSSSSSGNASGSSFCEHLDGRDSGTSKGAEVKKSGQVLKTLADSLDRQPNVNCRVESFGRMCSTFDSLRRSWVKDMGFGGLLHLQDRQLPRGLCYWLMTRIDPVNLTLKTCDGKAYRLSKNQVNWVFGIPKGQQPIPVKAEDSEMALAVDELNKRYGMEWELTKKKNNKVFKCRGIQITSKMIERAEGVWEENEEEEFKQLFLVLALHMVLCPTQGSKLGSDLAVAACLGQRARLYDWCGLVLDRLKHSVKSFAKRFNAAGYAGGCGGCTMFVAVFYLDKLNRFPIDWGVSPRVMVWTMEEIRKASSEDRMSRKGDYGKLGCLDVAYGEEHPLDARDKAAPPSDDEKDDVYKKKAGGKVRVRRRGIVGVKRRESNKRKRIHEKGESSGGVDMFVKVADPEGDVSSFPHLPQDLL